MSTAHDLHDLFDELANDHVVGEAPPFDERNVHRAQPGRDSRSWLALTAVAACVVVLIGGLVVIGSRNPGPEPAASDLEETAQPDTQLVDLIRIDAVASSVGTTKVELVFDRNLDTGAVALLEPGATAQVDRIAYATQAADSPASVCGSVHSFPPPGNRIVDVFIPSAWFHTSATFDPPISWEPNGEPPAKVIVCEPLGGFVQVSIWGAASAREEDVQVSVDGSLVTVGIKPDPTLTVPPSDCSDESASVCIADVASFESDVLTELDELDGSQPADMTAGVCTMGGSGSGTWSLCVVPLPDGRQVLIGRSDEDLALRTDLGDSEVEFQLSNAPGTVTVLETQSSSFDIIDPDGRIIGSTGGTGLVNQG